MIRIKCPKCSTALSLDDEEAGQVGQCIDCGAKFRVPARKPVPGRPGKETAAQRRPAAGRGRDDEDEDEQEDDEDALDQEDKARKPTKRSKKSKADSGASSIVLRVVFLVAVGVLGIGGVLINNLAILVGALSLVLVAVCGLLVGRGAKHLIMPLVGFVLLLAVCVGAWYIRDGRVDEQRKKLRDEMDQDLRQPR